MLSRLEYITRRRPGNTHRGNKPQEENGKTHDKLVSGPQFLTPPALPLSDGRGDENHDKRPVEKTLKDKTDEYRGRELDGHVC